MCQSECTLIICVSREYVASYSQGVLVARYTASSAGALNINITMNRTSNIESLVAAVASDNNTVTLVGSSGQSASEDPILWTGQARFVLDTGKHSSSGSISSSD
jgi:hypothetical protein